MSKGSFVLRMLSVPAVSGLLTALWVSAASAAEVCSSRQVSRTEVRGERTCECRTRSLANGRPGETVQTCENVRAPRVARRGTTKVWHARNGRLVAAR